MREVILQKQYQNESQSLEEKTIASIRQILESEAFQRVQNGERNDALISALQQNLLNLGYELGTTGVLKNGVDGDYGDLTNQAVNDFIKDDPQNVLRARYNSELASIVQANLRNGLSYTETVEMKYQIEVLGRSLNIDDPNASTLTELLDATGFEYLISNEDPDKEVPLSELGNLGKQLSDVIQAIEEISLKK